MSDLLPIKNGFQEKAMIRHCPRKPGLNIVGVSAAPNQAGCSLLRDGVLLAAAEEASLSKKNDSIYPRRSFGFCLQAADLTIADLDCVAWYEDPYLKLGKRIWTEMVPTLKGRCSESLLERFADQHPRDVIRESFGFAGPIEIVDRHSAQAASSYYSSGFEDAAILTLDDGRDWPTITYSAGCNSTIERLEQVDFPNSLLFFWDVIADYLGFGPKNGECEVMGLAPYGRPLYVEQLRNILEIGPNGQCGLKIKYFDLLNEEVRYADNLVSLLAHQPRNPSSEVLQVHKDIARSAQIVFEEVLLEKIRYLHTIAPSENLCMAGRGALNRMANRRCLREGPFKRLFIPPVVGDEGGSMGAAAIAHMRLGSKPLSRLQSENVGPKVSSAEVCRLLSSSVSGLGDYRGKESDMVAAVAKRLLQGKIIAWCRGPLGVGSLRLGSRCVLADPRCPEVQHRLKGWMGKRETFLPFTALVLESKAKYHFDLEHPLPSLWRASQVISSINLSAITLIDGFAHVQTVSDDDATGLTPVLKEFDRLTGCPVLLCVPFTVRERRVCTPLDALLSFVESQLDAMVIADFIFDRSGISPLWEFWAQSQ